MSSPRNRRPGPLSGDKGRARAEKDVEHEFSSLRHIFEPIGYELDHRMEREILSTAPRH